MFAVLGAARKVPKILLVIFAFVWLSACEMGLPGGGGGPRINTDRPVPVALLVPRGSAAATDAVLAQSLENAARLAMSELQGVTIDLRVYATGADATRAADMARQAVQDGAKIIIGPVYAANANAAGKAVAGRGVNVLAFSNNPDVAGGNVFILGNTFQNTANRLAAYAAAQGKSPILIVHGRDAAETAGAAAIQRAIARTGGIPAGVVSFELSQKGVINALPEISQTARDSGARAIFMTSGTAGALPLLAGLLPENGIKPEEYQYIGLQRWDIPANALSMSGLQGGWFALPDPNLQGQFAARYQAAYGDAPHPISGLAYDAIAAIGALVKAGNADALTGAALTQPSGFIGVNGIFRLLADGTNERGLAIAQIQDKQVVVIDPAPRSFGGAGF